MTDQPSRIAQMEQRIKAAPDGPWEHTADGAVWRLDLVPITVPVCCGNVTRGGECCGNPDPGQDWQQEQVKVADTDLDSAPFIAHAREDLPWAIEEIRRLTAERDAFEAALDKHLCAFDKADWLRCAGGHGDGYCEYCQSDKPHDHQRMVQLESQLAEAVQVRDRSDAKLKDLISLEASYRANERSMLQQLSEVLTNGNAGQWEEILHAAIASEAAREADRRKLEAVQEAIKGHDPVNGLIRIKKLRKALGDHSYSGLHD